MPPEVMVFEARTGWQGPVWKIVKKLGMLSLEQKIMGNLSPVTSEGGTGQWVEALQTIPTAQIQRGWP